MERALTLGRALLIDGILSPGEASYASSATVRLAEVLLASQTFNVQHLTPRGGDRHRPSQLALRFHAEALGRSGEPLVLLAARAALVDNGGRPALGVEMPGGYGHEALDFGCIASALESCNQLLVFLELERHTSHCSESLVELFCSRATRLIAIGEAGGGLLEAVVAGLRGAAAGATSGVISFASLAAHLDNVRGLALRATRSDDLVLLPPSPLGLWGLDSERPSACSPIDQLAGRTLPGHFYLESLLGSGAFGSVYAARQITLDREVAVKVVVADSTTEAQLFVNEVRAVSRLDHQNVVRIFQANLTPDGLPFCAMERLSGRSLRDVIDAGPAHVDRVLDLAEQLLSALEAVHDAGLIHGDVKPENLLVCDNKDGERLVLIDFGMATLAQAGARSLGGTPAYMAPEQLRGRLDPRSDLFAAGVVIHELITGSQPTRRGAGVTLSPLVPSQLREVLAKSVAADPTERFASAAAFAAALVGRLAVPPRENPAEPFRGFASFTEADEGSFYGRTDDAREIVSQALLHPIIIVTAPSGVGKTSILRAAVIPRMRRLGLRTCYFRCLPASTSITVEPDTVVIIDQVEALLLTADGERELGSLIGRCQESSPTGAAIFSVREDFLGRLMDLLLAWPSPPILRLAPLTREGGAEAIRMPLLSRRVDIARAALEKIVSDLQEAARELGPRMGWGTGAYIYPPHLQLVGAALFAGLSESQTIELEQLDSFHVAEVVGQHLERLLDDKLSDETSRIVRRLLGSLVGPDQTRAARLESELLASLPVGSARKDGALALELLRQRGLLVPIRIDDQRGWELSHDSLVPRILEWLDRGELDRRRVLELLRHHLRRSSPERPYLLARGELREVDRHPEVARELDRGRPTGAPSALDLVELSRVAARRRVRRLAAAALLVVGLGGALAASWIADRRARARDAAQRAVNLGRFELILEPFDWSPGTNSPSSVAASDLEPPLLTFYGRDPSAPDEPGETLEASLSAVRTGETSFAFDVEVRGGPAFLELAARGRRGRDCAPSWIRLKWLPGYVQRSTNQQLRLIYPTCAATAAGTVTIPAGPFVSGGRGIPPVNLADFDRPRVVLDVPAFLIQRTEVTNGAYRQYASMSELTGRAMPGYPSRGLLSAGSGVEYPVTNIDHREASDYCRFLGLRLPANREWEKAARGGLHLDAAATIANLEPERNVPWGSAPWVGRANLDPESDGFGATAPVGSFPEGASPYGVLDMAGNVHEWVEDRATVEGGNHRMVRGGSFVVLPENQHHTIAYLNARDERFRSFDLGVRCAGERAGRTPRRKTP